jgi:hypothetical protein
VRRVMINGDGTQDLAWIKEQILYTVLFKQTNTYNM